MKRKLLDWYFYQFEKKEYYFLEIIEMDINGIGEKKILVFENWEDLQKEILKNYSERSTNVIWPI